MASKPSKEELQQAALDLGVSADVVAISSKAELEQLIVSTKEAAGVINEPVKEGESEAEVNDVIDEVSKATEEQKEAVAEVKEEFENKKETQIKTGQVMEMIANINHDNVEYKTGQKLPSDCPHMRLFVKRGWVKSCN